MCGVQAGQFDPFPLFYAEIDNVMTAATVADPIAVAAVDGVGPRFLFWTLLAAAVVADRWSLSRAVMLIAQMILRRLMA